jgi:hypothetical protein
MALQQIADLLRQEASQYGQITLNDALLGSDGAFSQSVIADLLRPAGNVILIANAADIPTNPSGQSFSFPAGIPTTPADAFLNLSNQTATVTISQIGTVLQAELDIQLTVAYRTGATIPWIFSASFPELLGWPFDSMPFSAQAFQFVFAPTLLPVGLSNGLNFGSQIGLTGLLQAVADFLATFSVQPVLERLSGQIIQTTYGPTFDLTAPLGVPTIDMTALVIETPFVGTSMQYVKVQGSAEDYQPSGLLYLGATTALVNSSSTTVSLITVFRLPLQGAMPILSLAIKPTTSTDTSLNNLGSWMGGQTWDSFFAKAPANTLLPYLSNFGLRSYALEFNLGNFSIDASTLCAGTLEPWYVIPGNSNLVVRQFAVSWTVFQPLTNPQSMLAINCEMDMFGDGTVTFTGSILLPNLQVTLALASGPEMSAAQWLQTIVTAFGGGAVNPWLTSAMSGFGLEQMIFSVDTQTQLGAYTLVGGFSVCDTPVNFNLYFGIKLAPSFEYDVKLAFFFAGVRVAGEFTNANGSTIVDASWSNETNPLQLNNIAISLGYDSLGIPSELDMALTEVGVTYDITHSTFLTKAASENYGKADILIFKPSGTSTFVLFGGLDVDKPIDLTNLPLIGRALSLLERVEIRDLKVQVTSGTISQAQASQLNSLINTYAAGYPAVPPEGMASTVNISMAMVIGGFTVPLGTGVGGQSNTSMPADQSSIQGPAGGNTAAPVSVTPGTASNGTTWFNIQKAVGPVMFRRIGVRYQDAVLWFALDASFSAGGLTIDLLGMAIGSPLSDFDPEFTLDGLGIAFAQPGFELAGALMKVPPGPGVDWQYAGGALLKVANFSLGAVGSYASMSGTPSMFVFAQATGSFGGPPAFFITGLAAGFGYNSSLRLPTMDQIYQFPLIAGAQDPSKIGGSSPSPTTVLSILLGLNGGTPWITQQVGQYWFAAGLQFTSFQLVSTNALLVIEFGKRILFAILGLSRASFPMPGTAPASVRYAFVELQIGTIVDPDQGAFSLTAVLSPNSFLLDPSCKLTGGFAFYTWFAPSIHAGDFVITVGGYHPSFDPPSWYPQVPAVGFTWSLDSTVSITGKAYFALTPSAIMAGGQLSVTYQQGDLRAWFRAWANMLLYWNPFHFDVEIGITVGASYRLDLWFTTQTLSVELGASLHLWGPETGGEVTVHWWVISFTITFGAKPTGNPPPLDWTEFQPLLPPPADVVKIFPVDGLAPNGQTDMNTDDPWLARPSGFTFNTLSSIPSSQLQLGSVAASFKSGDLVNIRPMQQTGLTSTQTLVVTRDGIEIDLVASGWTVTELTQNVAKALWGIGSQSQMDPGTAQLVPNQLVGFTVSAPAEPASSSPGPVNEQYLSYTVLNPLGTMPIGPGRAPQGAIAQVAANTIELIESGIATTAITTARDAVFSSLLSLGIDPVTNGGMTDYANAAGALFTDEPLLIPATA